MQARANVMYYDDGQKKWIPMGMSKVQIYQHTVNNTFRVVGRKLQDHEVITVNVFFAYPDRNFLVTDKCREI